MSPSRDRQHAVTCNDRAHATHYTHLQRRLTCRLLSTVHAHGQQHQPYNIVLSSFAVLYVLRHRGSSAPVRSDHEPVRHEINWCRVSEHFGTSFLVPNCLGAEVSGHWVRVSRVKDAVSFIVSIRLNVRTVRTDDSTHSVSVQFSVN